MNRAARWVLGVGSWALGVSIASAQFFGELNTPIRRAPSVFPDWTFMVCRLAYRQVRTEGEDPAFFYQFSPNGCALGINVLLHAMTH